MMTKLVETKQPKRISPELAEVLHMLKALEAQTAPPKQHHVE